MRPAYSSFPSRQRRAPTTGGSSEGVVASLAWMSGGGWSWESSLRPHSTSGPNRRVGASSQTLPTAFNRRTCSRRPPPPPPPSAMSRVASVYKHKKQKQTHPPPPPPPFLSFF